MFIPEYTITPNILKYISSIEYDRAVIDNTGMLLNFEDRLEKNAYIEYVHGSLWFYGDIANKDFIKRQFENLVEIRNTKVDFLIKARSYAKDMGKKSNVDESYLKKFYKILTNQEPHVIKYRSKRINNKVEPPEILAEISELFDWYESIDSKDTNPIIVSGILKARLEAIQPYESLNYIISNLLSLSSLYNRGYEVANFISLEYFYNNSKKIYEENIDSTLKDPFDYTQWLEYYTQSFANQVKNITQTIKLYSKDTKLARFNTKIRLTERQEKIIEYLYDYGSIENKHFPLLFPNISEDTVLRELKKLIDTSIIIKTGSTKSSRYELV